MGDKHRVPILYHHVTVGSPSQAGNKLVDRGRMAGGDRFLAFFCGLGDNPGSSGQRLTGAASAQPFGTEPSRTGRAPL